MTKTTERQRADALQEEVTALKKRLARLEDRARSAVFKLDVEFHRLPGVAHLEGWAAANNLRRVLGKSWRDETWPVTRHHR